MKMLFKCVVVSCLLLMSAGFASAADDYTLRDCLADMGVEIGVTPRREVLKAIIACKDTINLEELKEKAAQAVAFKDCLNDNGVTEIADIMNIDNPREVIGECLEEAGVDVEAVKEELIAALLQKIEPVIEDIKERIADAANDIKACVEDIDLENMDRAEALAAMRDCLAIR